MKNELTKTTFKSALDEACYLFGRAICLGALSLVCSSAPAQNLFVSSDAAGGNIYEFTPNGVRSTFASGLAGALAFDKAGNLFVSDRGNIYKITPNGVRSTFASELAGALAVDSAGNLFVTTGYRDDFGFPINGSGKIYKLTPNGLRTTFASGLDLPTGLAFDSAGNLFVANVSKFINGAIYKFTPAGGRTTFASGLTNPEAVAFDNAGNLFVSAFYSTSYPGGAIYKITSGGVRSTFAIGVSPFAPMACDSAGNLFVSDFGGNIYKFTPSRVRSTFAPGVSGSLAFQPTLTPTATLVNISTRGSVETGDNMLISGFIVSGSDSQQVIIRGLGPTLTSFGVPDALQDPVLELHNTTSMMTSNDDWQSAANANQIPINYRPANSHESAIMTTLQPGAYTTVMHGKNSTTGIGLLEVYSTLSGLTNVSTRGFVGTGDHVLIGGFISSGGNGSLQVIIRALGPTLTQFGVSGALADPTLSLMDGNGNVVAFNDNWKNTQQTVIQNSGFAPPSDLESAILAILPNGNYTAIVSGKNGTTGVSLLEVYKVALATSSNDF
ncbi:MAG: hypothetical protein DME40_00700 [Verrucomicrobia bacterium]|nr:MAG: hypothetical protein DME37_11640 [Verrucomicrobiota bacterium]PYK95430.1 MAG: hypothetical protein DME40_00700 [Verrucomicrobiota bacterium]